MTCGETREYLFAFLDSELDTPLSIELQRHLDGCPACAREAEIEQTIRRRLVHVGKAQGKLALGLDQSIEDILGRCAATGPGISSPSADIAGQRIAARSSDVHTDSRSPGSTAKMNVGGAIARWRRPLATAAVLAIAVGASAWYAGRQRGQASGTSRFAELLAADFEHFRDEGSQVHFASSDRRAVADWLLEHTALAVVLPASGGSGRQLLGGRKCKINGQPAAFAIYDIDGVPVSVVVFAADVSELRGMEEVLRSDTTFWVDRCRGLVVAACRRDELVYAAVSTLAQEDLLNWLTEWKHQSP